ncbi:mechanosensitive ion channel protein MscS [Pontibacter litorisediminis]|uniref:mechanosensitive ion channel protein MscS n=1 Tax=Pontibacter litorisediminis TaxID=1846260 RepID=UPI0023EB41CB|nr:mechanosensitive ion channel protein MscS [Pontibacter litorisediminis]
MLKNIIYAVLLGAGMAACLSQQDKQNEEAAGAPEETMLPDATEVTPTAPDPILFVIDKERVGEVKIGMPIAQLQEQVNDGLHLTDTTLRQEGTQSTAYLLKPEGQAKGLLVEQQCEEACKVWRISVLSPDFKTAKDISVGSKYSELQQAYRIRKVTFEEGNLVALAPDAGMSFILDHSTLPKDQLSSVNAATVPANLLIRKILVY